ncbi:MULTISPECIES: hypothetical protein [unclassified Massilia]|nr:MULTISPECIES: hypothetical protein [unclassified Massilia]
MIDLNEQEIHFISGGVVVEGYPTSDPNESDPLKKPGPYNAYYAM